MSWTSYEQILAALGEGRSGCLRDCWLVVAKQQGKYVSYQLSDPRVTAVLELANE